MLPISQKPFPISHLFTKKQQKPVRLQLRCCSCRTYRSSCRAYRTWNPHCQIKTAGFETWIHCLFRSIQRNHSDCWSSWNHSTDSYSASPVFVSSNQRSHSYLCFVSRHYFNLFSYHFLIEKIYQEQQPFSNIWPLKDATEDHRKTRHSRLHFHSSPWLLFLPAPHPKGSSFCRKICGSAAMWKAQLEAIRCQAGECQLCSRYTASWSLSKPPHSHLCFLSRVLTWFAASIPLSPGEHSPRLSKRNSWEAASDRVSISHLRTLAPTSFLPWLTGYAGLC